MNSSVPDYQKLYKEQDKVIKLSRKALKNFYLTGGTALGRFYLFHRYSDDLDFFFDEEEGFSNKVDTIFNILQKNFAIDEEVTSKHETFVRIQVLGEEPIKLEFVNEKVFHWGSVHNTSKGILVDNPANILANKITTVLSRDEPKDVFDIISLGQAFSFNWKEVYKNAFKKHIMNEQDVAMRLSTFPVHLLQNQPWLPNTSDSNQLQEQLQTIVDDFLLARDNSLGAGKTPITEAKPNE